MIDGNSGFIQRQRVIYILNFTKGKKQIYLPKYLFLSEQEQNKIQTSNIYIQHTPLKIKNSSGKAKLMVCIAVPGVRGIKERECRGKTIKGERERSRVHRLQSAPSPSYWFSLCSELHETMGYWLYDKIFCMVLGLNVRPLYVG